jgi:hypothetical protein
VTPAAADTARAALHALKSRDKLFAKYVRHIWLEGSKLSIADAHDLLRISTQLTDLTVVAPFCTPALLPILRKLHLERFTGSLRLLFGDNAINLADAALESLTHLHIFDSIADHEQIRERLKSLKSLTHLTVPEITGPTTSVCDTIRIVFDQCPQLKIFVALCNADAKPSALPYDIPDQHLRRLVLTNFSWTAETWASGAMGGVDLWAAAEEYIARKQRGELPGESAQFLFDRSGSNPAYKRFGAHSVIFLAGNLSRSSQLKCIGHLMATECYNYTHRLIAHARKSHFLLIQLEFLLVNVAFVRLNRG